MRERAVRNVRTESHRADGSVRKPADNHSDAPVAGREKTASGSFHVRIMNFNAGPDSRAAMPGG